jgi:hypothetical protein
LEHYCNRNSLHDVPAGTFLSNLTKMVALSHRIGKSPTN